MATTTRNPLITTRAPEAALNVQLHPLVLLTISDYITRHISRQQTNAIVGCIIGQQTGRNFTLEHAYEIKTLPSSSSGEQNTIDREWFTERLEQYRDVHKAPALDLVGIFTLAPVSGPGEAQRAFVKEVQDLTGSDSVMLLLFHPEMVEGLQGGKLPISLYESVKEVDAAAGAGEVEIKFRELTFEVETGEAEMIGVDFVATGAGIASAVPKAESTTVTAAASSATAAEAGGKEKKAKGKAKAKEGDDPATNGAAPASTLSPEDEELIASLTAKANAIKMLNQRLNLIRAYLGSQPASYLTNSTLTTLPAEGETNHTLLRSINAMLSRLPLLTPPSGIPSGIPSASQPQSAPESNNLPPVSSPTSKETADVHLTTLLASLTRSIAEAQALGTKFGVYSRDRASKERDRFGTGGRGGGRLGFGDEGGILLGD